MTDLRLYRRLLGQARPYWRHIAGMFGLSLLATPLALLTPLPLAFMEEAVFRGVVLEQFCRALPGDAAGRGIAVGLSALVFAAVHFLRPQKRTLLPRILQGDLVVWELYTEPDAGSDLPSLKTTAVRDSDEYVFNG